MLVEDIQRQRRNHRVTHGVLLIEEPGISARLHVVPCAPFVNYQVDPPVVIVAVHYLNVAGDYLVNVIRLCERGVIFVAGEFGGTALVTPVVGDGVIMQRQTVHVVLAFFIIVSVQL